MSCPSCGTTSARTQLLPGYWRCDAVVEVDELVGAGSGTAPAGGEPRRCGAVYLQTRTDDSGPQTCRCGEPAVGECAECTRLVCADHSDLWQGWRVCDRDLATARMRARAAALAEERRIQEAAAAAEAERRRLRNTLLDLSPAQALELLYVQQPRTEQEIRSADTVLRRLPGAAFTRLCLDVLPGLGAPERTRRSGLRRLSGWPFAGPHYHGRSWLLTHKGDWYRSGSYGISGAEQGHRGEKVPFDDTEKRAVIYEMAWQQSVASGVA
ncbi:hypothetical protein [Geodermatophilus sp. SYSU D00815]